MIADLSDHLGCDPHWLPIDNPRQDPEYILECFQRTIFDFLKSNWDEPFMTLEKSHTGRDVGHQSLIPSRSSNTIDSLLAQSYRPEPATTGVSTKRRREPFCMVSISAVLKG